jgi:hypothetical protein
MIRSDFSVVCSPQYVDDRASAKSKPHERSTQLPGQGFHSRITSNICPGSGLAFDIAADRDAMMPKITKTTLHACPCPFTTDTSARNLNLSVPSVDAKACVVPRFSCRSCVGKQRALEILKTWSELSGAHQ